MNRVWIQWRKFENAKKFKTLLTMKFFILKNASIDKIVLIAWSNCEGWRAPFFLWQHGATVFKWRMTGSMEYLFLFNDLGLPWISNPVIKTKLWSWLTDLALGSGLYLTFPAYLSAQWSAWLIILVELDLFTQLSSWYDISYWTLKMCMCSKSGI